MNKEKLCSIIIVKHFCITILFVKSGADQFTQVLRDETPVDNLIAKNFSPDKLLFVLDACMRIKAHLHLMTHQDTAWDNSYSEKKCNQLD